MRVYILRHGQTDKNKQNVLQGRSDLPMNEAGLHQAEETGAYFRSAGYFPARCPELSGRQNWQRPDRKS